MVHIRGVSLLPPAPRIDGRSQLADLQYAVEAVAGCARGTAKKLTGTTSVPLSHASNSHVSTSTSQVTPAAIPATANINLPFVANTPTAAATAHPVNTKRNEPPLTPAANVDGSDVFSQLSSLSAQVSDLLVQGSSAVSSSTYY
ncbi:hypothetical protein BDZ97DRAFT_1914018 [Flammula alnicola]|nr:hypothetical protein BDZ97DRAFT_1914018 [Flammula alnicola]